jgi:iron complex transport system substrate-binding protein
MLWFSSAPKPRGLFAAGVISLNLCTDQLLVMLAPEHVLALERLARDPALSFVAPQARHLPVVQADAEAVLALHPDLVLAGRYGAQTTVALLRQRGLRVAQFDEAENFGQIAEQTQQVATLLGVPERGRALVASMRARLAAIRPRLPARTAILWQARGWTAGPGSLGDAILRAAGLRNLGTGGVIGVEAMLTHPPDLLVTETAPDYPSLATDLVHGLALPEQESVDPALLICGGPFSVAVAEALAR